MIQLPTLLETYFEPLYHIPCWGVELGYGKQITLNFGTPALSIREPKHILPTAPLASRQILDRRNVTLRGEWRLWITFCNWRIRIGGAIEGKRTDQSTRRIQRAVASLDGQILTHVRVHPQTAATIFTFDLGGQLETIPYDTVSEQWVLFTPSRTAVVVRSDGFYSADEMATPPAEVVWQRIPPEQIEP